MHIDKLKLAANFTGDRPQTNNRLVIKSTLLHDVEISRFSDLLDHPSTHLNKSSRVSMSLILRRALALLSDHQKKSLTSQDSIEKERMTYLYLARSGETPRGFKNAQR